MIRTLITCLLLTSSSSSLAEIIYVTDMLRLNVSEQAQSRGKTVQTLSSGDILTVLERRPGYVKVKTQEGEIGWAKAAYLVSEKPARLVLSEMESQVERIKLQLNDANKNALSASDHAEKLQDQLQTSEKNALHYQNLLAQMKQQNQQYESSMTRFETCVPLTILLIACIVCLSLGLYISWYIIDYRLRKRHGGFRL